MNPADKLIDGRQQQPVRTPFERGTIITRADDDRSGLRQGREQLSQDFQFIRHDVQYTSSRGGSQLEMAMNPGYINKRVFFAGY